MTMNEMAEQHEKSRDNEERMAEEDRRRAHDRRPLDFDDPDDLEAQAVRQDAEYAAEMARRAELPVTRGQMQELIGLVRDVLTALQRR